MKFTLSLDVGRTACVESIDGFLRAVESLTEYDMLGASRCHGWSRLDVVTHVVAGWQEMLGGLVSPVDAEPTVDAASYWAAFDDQYATDDPVPALMAQRRRTAAYARPASATTQLHDVGEALRRGVTSYDDRRCLWQGHIFTAGDFLVIWAVENAVHHLDLLSAEPVPPSALGLARATVEAIVDASLPTGWSDVDAVLIGTGRVPVPDEAGRIGLRLPALG